MAAKRGWGEGSIYWDEKRDRFIGAVSVTRDGRRERRKVSGKTKGEVRAKLKRLQQEAELGLKPSSGYTVRKCLEDFIASLTTKSPGTVEMYKSLASTISASEIGSTKLTDLSAGDVEQALGKLAENMSDATLRHVKGLLKRSIARAEKHDLVGRNVAALADLPKGKKQGNPSQSFTVEQVEKLLEATKGTWLETYIIMNLFTGLRPDEIRALRWDHIDLDTGTVSVFRSTRFGGDVKTQQSRRVLAMAGLATEALKRHRKAQREDRIKARPIWQDNDLVFCQPDGQELTDQQVRVPFQRICNELGLGPNRKPRELRTTTASFMSYAGVPLEEISRVLGHTSTRVTELVYRKELRPKLTAAAVAMDAIFAK